MSSPSSPGSFLRGLWAVFLKDLTAEWRSREILTAQWTFALLVIFIFDFALEFDPRAQQRVAVGVLWTLFVFAGTLGLNRSLSQERENACLEGLLLAPVDRGALFLGKVLANLVFLLGTALVVIPVYTALYNVSLFHPGFLMVLLLGFVGYISVGTLLATMTVQARTRDILLPLLLFPVVLPILISAVRASEGFLTGVPWEELRTWVQLLVVYDVLFGTAAFLAFDFVVEA